ncbi:MAG: hypothetical protein PF517_01590, partial [Salinivirgaceae bacterium]|nr:hypothetical protein [Salinivirgaceae bacterium]
GFYILSSLPRLFRGNEKYENLTRPQSIEQICDSESLNLGYKHLANTLLPYFNKNQPEVRIEPKSIEIFLEVEKMKNQRIQFVDRSKFIC